ncbi:MAG: MauE/DoxX family redox-associated membrane protein [Propionicimonas sp.]|uniref:DoxX family protein n=1 Tax=Propionicimonas sp. TaxID=1955623 RepID=UPI003D138487
MSDSAAAPFRRPWPEWVTLATRLILGGVLLVAGLLKVTRLEASVQSVRLYQLLPWEVTAAVGSALPIIEIATGLLLITGTFTRVSAVIGSLLMVAFIIGIASVWARGISIDCGCFGGGGEIDAAQTQYPLEIARDAGLLLAGAWTAWRPRSPWAVDNWLFGTADDPLTIEEDDKEPTR